MAAQPFPGTAFPGLLTHTPQYPAGATAERERLGAVYVPTHRPPGISGDGLGLGAFVAEDAGAQLVVGRSGAACAEPFPASLAPASGPPVLVLDLLPERLAQLPVLASDRHRVAALHRTGDIAAKRNVFLLLGILAGWECTLMLDDDIKLEPAGHGLSASAGELRVDDVVADFAAYAGLHAAGFVVRSFHDHSVLYHARRLVGQPRDGFLGAGAMFMRCSRSMPFFPDIYNSDWGMLYPLLSSARHQYPSSAVKIVGALHQGRYDPFVVARARAEELGDTFIEGLYALLPLDRQRRSSFAGSRDYWVQVLRDRRSLILDTLIRIDQAVPALGEELCSRASDAVQAGFAVHNELHDPAQDLADYFRRWCHDLVIWREYVDRLCRDAGNAPVPVDEALKILGLYDAAHWIHPTPLL